MEENIWMLNINPGSRDEKYKGGKVLEFCHEKNIIGVGWSIREKLDSSQSDVIKKAKDLLAEEYKEKYGAVIRFIDEIQINDFVWVYDKTKGNYFLCKVISNWVNKTKEDYPQREYPGIAWYRQATWKEISRDLIPSHILRNSHIRTLSKCKNLDHKKKEYIKRLFEEDQKKIEPDIAKIKSKILSTEFKEFLEFVDPNELEDIVCNFIQSKGWRLIKSTASSNLPDFECEFKKVSSNTNEIHTAYAQVKSGKQTIKDTDLKSYKRAITENIKVFLFSITEINLDIQKGIEIITIDELKEYVAHHLPELRTSTLINWTRLAKD